MSVKLSVIIPVYNAARYLRQCLDSVLGQTLREIEVICVDDGSSDESPAILGEYMARDARVKLIRQANSGPGCARNRGLDEAVGAYVQFLDADDWFEPDMFSAMTALAECRMADITLCRTERFDAQTGSALSSAWMLKETYLPGDVFAPDEIAGHLFQFTYGQVWDKLYRLDFLRTSGIRFPELLCAEDTSFAYCTLLAAGRIAVLPEIKVHYRVNQTHSVSRSLSRQPDAPFRSFEMIRNYLNAMPGGEKYRESFLNWAMEYLVWQLNNMPDAEIRRQYWKELKNKWFPELRFSAYPAGFWQSRPVFFRYWLVEHLPYAVYSILLTCYKTIT